MVDLVQMACAIDKKAVATYTPDDCQENYNKWLNPQPPTVVQWKPKLSEVQDIAKLQLRSYVVPQSEGNPTFELLIDIWFFYFTF